MLFINQSDQTHQKGLVDRETAQGEEDCVRRALPLTTVGKPPGALVAADPERWRALSSANWCSG
jgi:hypothetical protein